MKLKKTDKCFLDKTALNYVSFKEKNKIKLCKNVAAIDPDSGNFYFVRNRTPVEELRSLEYLLIEEEEFEKIQECKIFNKNVIIYREDGKCISNKSSF